MAPSYTSTPGGTAPAGRDAPQGLVRRALRRVAPLAALLGGTTLAPSTAQGQLPDWAFDDAYDSDLVFIHPLANYSLSPHWIREWERNLASRSSGRTTVGSVNQKTVFNDTRVRIDESLGDSPFRFLYSLRWLGGEHVDREILQQFVGLELSVTDLLGFHALVHPTPDKGDVDASFGLIVADASRERFLRASLRLDDLLYGDRNREGGESVQEAISVQWEGRYAGGRWELFTEGLYGRPSERMFPDTVSSPDVVARTDRTNGSSTRLRWLSGETSFLEIALDHYSFEDRQAWRDPLASYTYENRVTDLLIRYAFPLGQGRWRAWPGVHWLTQDADATGREEQDFRRTDVMPAVFVEYLASGANSFELGYMGSASTRTLQSADPEQSFDRTAWADKVKLGWTHRFSPSAQIQFSLSHEVAPDRFGGANVQFLAFF
jgi:hypothetical protein